MESMLLGGFSADALMVAIAACVACAGFGLARFARNRHQYAERWHARALALRSRTED
jgi:hypothetical protein